MSCSWQWFLPLMIPLRMPPNPPTIDDIRLFVFLLVLARKMRYVFPGSLHFHFFVATDYLGVTQTSQAALQLFVFDRVLPDMKVVSFGPDRVYSRGSGGFYHVDFKGEFLDRNFKVISRQHCYVNSIKKISFGNNCCLFC